MKRMLFAVYRPIILLLFSLFLWPGVSRAASFTVTRSDDVKRGACNVGDCSLREAIIAANTAGGANTITLPAGTYSLSLTGADEDAAATGDLDITAGTLMISGAGRNTTIIDGGQIDRIFDLFKETTVSINGVTLRNGKGNIADTSNFSQANGGGAIRAYESNLTLTSLLLTQNTSASHGGAIAFNNTYFGRPIRTTLTMSDTIVRNNLATINGGGMMVGGGATVNVTNSSMISNTARATSSGSGGRYGGGGLYVAQGFTPIGGDFQDTVVTIKNSTFEDNFTSDKNGAGQISGAAWGGAIHLETSTVTISKSTFTDNKAEGRSGGAIYADGASLTINSQSIFHKNRALDEGGAIAALGVPFAAISDSSFTNNEALAEALGGGGAILGSGQLNGGAFLITNASFEHNATAGSGGALKLGAHVTLDNVDVISNTAGANGGGISISNSTLDAPTQIKSVTISDNYAFVRGGGIQNGGVLYLADSLVNLNRAHGEGGGVSNYQAFALVITNTEIISNVTAANGGGLYDNHGVVGSNGNNPHTSLLTDVTIEENQAGGDGGGLYNLISIKIMGASISHNRAITSGGGLLTYSALTFPSDRQNYPVQLDLTNVTMHDNQALEGGAIYQNGGVSKLNNVTIAGNSATGVTKGGGIYYDSSNPGDAINPNTITVQNSIIANNTATLGPDCANTITSAGNNLVGNNSDCSLSAASDDQVGTSGAPIDPQLGPLADHGGATKTLALQSGSPAINNGNDATCAIADQRGALRVESCDVGAFEFGSVPKQTQTIFFPKPADKNLGDAPFTLTAQASSALPISFSSNTPTVCTVSGSTVTLAALGTCIIVATQAGNAEFKAATPVSQSFQVNERPPDPNKYIYIPLMRR